jgi:hypothetical protein
MMPPNGNPDAAATVMRPDGGVGGGSSTNRDNDDHNADGNRRHRCHPCPRRAAMVVAMMTIVGKRGGEVTARRLQGDDEVTEMQGQSAMAPARARLIEFEVQGQG